MILFLKKQTYIAQNVIQNYIKFFLGTEDIRRIMFVENVDMLVHWDWKLIKRKIKNSFFGRANK